MAPKRVAGPGNLVQLLLACRIEHWHSPTLAPRVFLRCSHYILQIDCIQWDGSVMYLEVGKFYSPLGMQEISEQLMYYYPATKWRLSFA